MSNARNSRSRLGVPLLLLMASFCFLPARPAAADDKDKKQAATRPAGAEEVAPLEAITPVAKDGPKLPRIADDSDVSVIAAHAARMAIDLLIPPSPHAFPNSVHLIRLTNGWISDTPVATAPTSA